MAITNLVGSFNLRTPKAGPAPEYTIDGVPISISNRVVINDASDFPAAVAGVITLAANTEYYIGSDTVNIGTDRFQVSSNVTISGAVAPSVLTSTTTGALFTGADLGLFTLRNFDIDLPNAKMYDINDTIPGTTNISIVNVTILRADSIGDFEDIFSINLQSAFFLSLVNGLTLTRPVGIISVIAFRQVSMRTTNVAFKGIDLGASVSPTIDIQNMLFNGPSGAIAISGLANNGNVSSGSVAAVDSCEFLGGITALENITKDDIRWSFDNSPPIPDTNPDALISFSGGSATTTIATQGVGVQVNATWSEDLASHFSTDAAGNITYNGERDISLPIDVDLGVKSASSTFDSFVQIAIDGTPISSGVPVNINTSKQSLARASFQHVFINSEVLTFLVVNKDGTQNIVVESGTARVR